MIETMSDDVVRTQAGIAADSPLNAVLDTRADVLGMTQATHDAALQPKDPGGIPHVVRAALATRVARLHGESGLAAHYEGLMRQARASAAISRLADPAFQGDGDAKLTAVLAFTDIATQAPRDATANDIAQLQQAGVSDADIVRLAELNAFLAYQIRLIAGLRLMKEFAQ
jgi:CMD domain protein